MGTGSLVEIAHRWRADAAGLVAVTVVEVGVIGLSAQTITESRMVVVTEKGMEEGMEKTEEVEVKVEVEGAGAADVEDTVSVLPCSDDVTGCPELLSTQVIVKLVGCSYTAKYCGIVDGLAIPYTPRCHLSAYCDLVLSSYRIVSYTSSCHRSKPIKYIK